MTKTVTRSYDNYEHTNAVISELKGINIDADDISVIANNEHHAGLNDSDATLEDTGTAASTGAGVGGVIGGGAGLLTGLGLMAIPGVGPLVAAGWLATTAVGAATGAMAGAATGGLIGAMTDNGIDADDAHTYAESVRRGSVLVSVRADDTNVGTVTAIMDRHHPSDLQARSLAWKADGWTGYDPLAKPYTRDQMMADQQRYS